MSLRWLWAAMGPGLVHPAFPHHVHAVLTSRSINLANPYVTPKPKDRVTVCGHTWGGNRANPFVGETTEVTCVDCIAELMKAQAAKEEPTTYTISGFKPGDKVRAMHPDGTEEEVEVVMVHHEGSSAGQATTITVKPPQGRPYVGIKISSSGGGGGSGSGGHRLVAPERRRRS